MTDFAGFDGPSGSRSRRPGRHVRLVREVEVPNESEALLAPRQPAITGVRKVALRL
jgi:hypothetical protein